MCVLRVIAAPLPRRLCHCSILPRCFTNCYAAERFKAGRVAGQSGVYSTGRVLYVEVDGNAGQSYISYAEKGVYRTNVKKTTLGINISRREYLPGILTNSVHLLYGHALDATCTRYVLYQIPVCIRCSGCRCL